MNFLSIGSQNFMIYYFIESGEGPFEVPPRRTKVGIIRKLVSGDPNLYVFHDRKSSWFLC